VKVEAPGPAKARALRPGKGAAAATAGGFRLDPLHEPASSGPAASAVPAAAVAGLLQLQEVPDAGQGRSAGLHRGRDLLDGLDAVRLAILDGRIAPPALARLVRLLAAQRAQVTDPGLAQVLAEIELRTAVELAKLEQAGAADPPGST